LVTFQAGRQLRFGARFRTAYPRRMRGFTFLVLMAIIVIIGIGLLEVNEIWATTRKREKEQELLFIGHQFRQAIQQYEKNNPKGNRIGIYPARLEDMLLDPRYPEARRYLRKIYIDPMTGKDEWGLLKHPDGGIYGVYSLSEEAPIKHGNFDLEDAGFQGATGYTGWKFVYSPQPASSPVATNVAN
jgi:type II secretory pathway pseudopilin PulG